MAVLAVTTMRLFKAFNDFSSAQGIDLNIAAKTHGLFRAAGLADIEVDLVARVHPSGHFRRQTLISFVNNIREQLIEGGHIGRDELDREIAALEAHLADPGVQVTSHMFYRLTGRAPVV